MSSWRLFFYGIRGEWRLKRGKYHPSPFHLRGRLTEIVAAEEGGGFSSFCPEFKVASCGDTELRASQMLAEAVACVYGDGDSDRLGEQPDWDGAEEHMRYIMGGIVADTGSHVVYHGPMRH